MLAATLGAVAVATLVRPGRGLEAVGAFGFVVVYAATLINGRFYVEVGAPSILLLALSPLATLALRARRIRDLGPVRSALVVGGLAAVVGAAAFGLAWLNAPDYGDYY